MTEARSYLIRLSSGRTRVLRLHADGERCYPLAYTVERGQAMCERCGCTDRFGCARKHCCYWVDASKTLCSRCSERMNNDQHHPRPRAR
jgi:hypothetical protein